MGALWIGTRSALARQLPGKPNGRGARVKSVGNVGQVDAYKLSALPIVAQALIGQDKASSIPTNPAYGQEITPLKSVAGLRHWP